MMIFRFPITNADEMVVGVERVRSFLIALGDERFKFVFTGNGRSTGLSVCEVELEFDDQQAGEDALCAWRAFFAFNCD